MSTHGALDWVSDEQLRRGTNQPAPEAIHLRAGRLEMLLEDGALRYLRWGEVEIVRMIYAAVRDENWLTIPFQTISQTVETRPDSFEIHHKCLYQQGKIAFEADFLIAGTVDERVIFSMNGEAQSEFRANRIGFCILHPTAECVGKPCRITSPDGVETASQFPLSIAPHQPFFDVRAMNWQPSPNCAAHLLLEGETFETEDHRNWTDASFKTYCRPLALPFPFAVEAGQRFEQRVSLSLEAAPDAAPNTVSARRNDAIVFSLRNAEPLALPPIGLGTSSDLIGHNVEEIYAPHQIEALRALPLSHLRAEMHLSADNWRHEYSCARREARLLDLPLELALFFGPQPEDELREFAALWKTQPHAVKSICVLHRDHKTTPDELAARLFPILRASFPDVLLGGGTDAFFAELNRARPAFGWDFLAFSLNPQVHAEDDRSIVENLAAQRDVIQSARAIAGNRHVHVSPVTLKRRNNPDATSSAPHMSTHAAAELPLGVDARQMSLLAGGWLAGSLKHLIEARADSVTFFETIGMRGIGQSRLAPPKSFAAVPGMFFPAFFVLRELRGWTHLVPSRSSDALRVDGFVLRDEANAHRQKIVLANFSAQAQIVRLEAETRAANWRVLDEVAFRRCASEPQGFDDDHVAIDASDDLTLPPYALGALETL